MVEVGLITFDHREVAEALVKHQGIHEGFWGVYVEFGLHATNIGPSDQKLVPSAIVGVLKMGIQKSSTESNLTVDAAKVNPRPRSKRKTTRKSKK